MSRTSLSDDTHEIITRLIVGVIENVCAGWSGADEVFASVHIAKVVAVDG